MFKKSSVSLRISLTILISSFSILASLIIFNYYYTKDIIEKNVQQNVQHLGESIVNKIEGKILETKKVTESMALYIESANHTQENIRNFNQRIVLSNPELYGSAIAYEPFMFDPSINLFSSYYYLDKSILKSSDLSKESYYYPKWDWYRIPKEINKPLWSEPYFDDGGGNVPMTTYSIPFYKTINEKKVFAGIVTCDLSLKWITDYLSNFKIYETGYIFITSQKGLAIVHPNKEIVLKQSIFETAEKYHDTDLASIAKKMVNGETCFLPYYSDITKKSGYIYFTPIPSTKWSLAILFPQHEIMSDLERMNYYYITFGFFSILFLFLLIFLISKTMTNSIRVATSAVEAIADGNIANAYTISYNVIHKLKYLEKFSEEILLNEPNKFKKLKNEIIKMIMSILKMSDKLRILIGQVQQSQLQVTTSTVEISASARELEATVAEQSASIREVTATTKEISATSRDLVQTMNKVGDNLQSTSSLAEEGKNDLSKMEFVINNMVSATSSISAKLSIINENANNISMVVTTINKISDQTNLLSLNAAIEAEKAGEYGKGFSVVAREISRLADQTAIATQDIDIMVKAMLGSVNSGVMEMDKFGDEIRRGTKEIFSIGERLSKIIEQVHELNPEFIVIEEGMQAQAQGAEQIKEAMVQLTTVSEQTRESLQEFKRATEQLNDAVYILQTEVQKFKIN